MNKEKKLDTKYSQRKKLKIIKEIENYYKSMTNEDKKEDKEWTKISEISSIKT